MSDLADFLRARYGEDEAAARAAASVAGPDWTWRTDVTLNDETTDYVTTPDGVVLMDTMGGIEDNAPHVARHDPETITAKLDEVISRIGQDIDPFLTAAARRALESVDW